MRERQTSRTRFGDRLIVLEVAMENTHNALAALKHELEFLDKGGYRATVGSRQPVFCMETSADWKPALFFEDSPICPKRKYNDCSPDRDCLLMGFVPMEHRHEIVPCRHIPLNEKGDTIESLSRTVGHDQAESALRTWLVKRINELQPA
jgi:hypothetical protein